MTEQERADKLRARMNRWQSYVEKPQTQAKRSDATEAAPAAPLPASIGSDNQTPRLTAEVILPVRAANGNTPPTATPPAMETQRIIALHEAHIAELKTAIEYERDLSRRLAEDVAREQNLHALTLQSRERPPTPTDLHSRPDLPVYPQEWNAGLSHYEEKRRAKLFIWFSVLLLITGVCCILGFQISR